MVFKPGQSGNPLGAKLYQQKPLAFLAKHHAPAVFNAIVKIAKDPKAPHAARVSAGQIVLDRAYGKAPSFSTGDATSFKRAVDMTDDELAAIASGAKLTVIK